eukprot:TRINITY_DN2495_c0_g1_i1.p1 TRINITY_DN2495_c0_g1~~TRINITY_DN2495_c0_g1_i1.p1  ORF type:complete len:346 (-),score=87.13 TRINITY_DN2495_c0_g1_i1:8-1045(-)
MAEQLNQGLDHISQEFCQKFAALFSEQIKDNSRGGWIKKGDAKKMILQYFPLQVNNAEISRLLDFAGCGSDNRLTMSTFIIAARLFEWKSSNQPLPSQLPTSLVQTVEAFVSSRQSSQPEPPSSGRRGNSRTHSRRNSNDSEIVAPFQSSQVPPKRKPLQQPVQIAAPSAAPIVAPPIIPFQSRVQPNPQLQDLLKGIERWNDQREQEHIRIVGELETKLQESEKAWQDRISDLEKKLQTIPAKPALPSLSKIEPESSIDKMSVDQLDKLENQYEETLKHIRQLKVKRLRDQKEDEDLCCICMENNRDTILLNCAHICVCQNCADGLKICPMCRSTIVQAVKYYR